MTPKEWAPLVPEFICEDLARSRSFYCDLIGFSIRFARPEDGFVYLDLDGAQLMLEEKHAECWMTGPLDAPFGRGMNLHIEVADIAAILGRLEAAGIRLFREAREAWYRDGDIEHGQIEALVQDPDGYLLRFVEVTGTRPASVIEVEQGQTPGLPGQPRARTRIIDIFCEVDDGQSPPSVTAARPIRAGQRNLNLEWAVP